MGVFRVCTAEKCSRAGQALRKIRQAALGDNPSTLAPTRWVMYFDKLHAERPRAPQFFLPIGPAAVPPPRHVPHLGAAPVAEKLPEVRGAFA
jgi:hypothetical protein